MSFASLRNAFRVKTEGDPAVMYMHACTVKFKGRSLAQFSTYTCSYAIPAVRYIQKRKYIATLMGFIVYSAGTLGRMLDRTMVCGFLGIAA